MTATGETHTRSKHLSAKTIGSGAKGRNGKRHYGIPSGRADAVEFRAGFMGHCEFELVIYIRTLLGLSFLSRVIPFHHCRFELSDDIAFL